MLPRTVHTLIRHNVMAMALALAARHAIAEDACPVIDAIAPLAEPHPRLYAEQVLGLAPGAEMDRQILASLERARTATDRDALNFPVSLADTLGQLDGAGRLNHEFFHRYHFEAAGFSDDPEDKQAIWRSSWAEGLASYVSERLTPGATSADALLSSTLETRARPLLPRLAADLLGGLDRTDKGRALQAQIARTLRAFAATSPDWSAR